MSDDRSRDNARRSRSATELGAEPDDLVIGPPGKVVALIKSTGEVVFNDGVAPDEAAQTFWDALGEKRLEMDERFLIMDHMEAILTRLGHQDLRTEDLRFRALAAEEKEPGSDEARALLAAAETSMAQLTMIAHEAVELGRALARRGKVVPEMPTQVPQSIQNDEGNNYLGKKGLPKDEERIVVNVSTDPKSMLN